MNWESVSKVAFFAGLGPAAIADVTHMVRSMDLPSRTMIIRKGHAGDCMYFIAAGEVEVDLPGKKVRLGEGAFFGEMALLGNNLRSANITTTRVSKLLVLDLVDFRMLMARHADLAETIDAEAKRRELENKYCSSTPPKPPKPRARPSLRSTARAPPSASIVHG